MLLLAGSDFPQGAESPESTAPHPFTPVLVRGRPAWVGKTWGLYEMPTRFVLSGTEYDLAPRPAIARAGPVQWMTYGGEPKVVANVPLAYGGTVEVHGYATHYNQDWVTAVWTDDTFQHLNCWVPSAAVRCAEESAHPHRRRSARSLVTKWGEQ